MNEDPFQGEIDWPRVRPVLDEAIEQLGSADRSAILLRFTERLYRSN
jgi:hypothetical protein